MLHMTKGKLKKINKNNTKQCDSVDTFFGTHISYYAWYNLLTCLLIELIKLIIV